MKKKFYTAGITIGYYLSCVDREILFAVEHIHGRGFSKEKRAAIRKEDRRDFEDLLPWTLAKLTA